MKLKKLVLALSVLGTTSYSSAGLIIFDDNLGGAQKFGSVETGVGQSTNGAEPVGDPLVFSSFNVSGGRSNNYNLANATTFNVGAHIDTSYRAYQDLAPKHGGLGVVSADSFSGDNLRPGNGDVRDDEILFFEFNSIVTLNTVFFNGAHQENTTPSEGNEGPGNGWGDTDLFNIFYSTDGQNYTSINAFVSGLGTQREPTANEYIDVDAGSYMYWAVAGTGWGHSDGGYVEAIDYTSVPEPTSLALLGLGLAGLGVARRSQKT